MTPDSPAWDDNLSLNHPLIDRQHREILHRIDVLPESDDADFDQAMRFFLRYTFEHFRDEEALLNNYEYPARAAHIKTHRAIEAAFDRHFDRYLKGDIDYARFKEFLNQWISQHILKEDRQFAAFLATFRD